MTFSGHFALSEKLAMTGVARAGFDAFSIQVKDSLGILYFDWLKPAMLCLEREGVVNSIQVKSFLWSCGGGAGNDGRGMDRVNVAWAGLMCSIQIADFLWFILH